MQTHRHEIHGQPCEGGDAKNDKIPKKKKKVAIRLQTETSLCVVMTSTVMVGQDAFVYAPYDHQKSKQDESRKEGEKEQGIWTVRQRAGLHWPTKIRPQEDVQTKYCQVQLGDGVKGRGGVVHSTSITWTMESKGGCKEEARTWNWTDGGGAEKSTPTR